MILMIVVVLIAVFFTAKYFIKGDDGVPFEMLEKNGIPKKIQEILPRYKSQERALVCKLDETIYVIVTRGEKPTGGYGIIIDKIDMEKEEDKVKVVVYVKFKDPKPGDMVTQVVTYPYVVAKTNLKELPDKIELKVGYDD